MRCRFTLLAAAAAVVLLAPGCARQTQPARYSLSGRVRLVGYTTDSTGRFTGTRVVEDADGVPVDLMFGEQVAARTTTSKGAYRFSNVNPGGYRVFAHPTGIVADLTNTLTIADRDVVALDTLVLRSIGDLIPIPNPSNAPIQVTFNIPDSEFVVVQVEDIAGNLVRELESREFATGSQLTTWDGNDANAHSVTPGLYWCTLMGLSPASTDLRAQLLFRE